MICMLGCKERTLEQPISDARPAAACPGYLDLELIGGESRFDPGWGGTVHGVGLPKGSQISVKVDSCDADCRRCRFHGPVRGDPALSPVITQRCLKDASKVCARDGDCGSTDSCRFMFPPIAARGQINTCSIAYYEPVAGDDPSPAQGVIDLQTGETDMEILNILITLSVEDCVECVNDSKQNDGVKDGTCLASNPAIACDTHGTGVKNNVATSFDCPRKMPGQSTIALGTRGTSTSSVGWTMDATRPRCTAMNAMNKQCWCGMCSNGTPCTKGQDCPDRVCGAAASPTKIPWNVANNNCMGHCNWDAASQSGTCSDNPVLACFSDAEPIQATGVAEVNPMGYYIIQLANLVCMPSFNTGTLVSAAVDGFGGFPGPFLFQARFRVTTRPGP